MVFVDVFFKWLFLLELLEFNKIDRNFFKLFIYNVFLN